VEIDYADELLSSGISYLQYIYYLVINYLVIDFEERKDCFRLHEIFVEMSVDAGRLDLNLPIHEKKSAADRGK
jgi:hypothetical protein